MDTTTALFNQSRLSRVAVELLDHSIGNPVNARMVAALKSAPELINLGSGTPDLPTPDSVIEAVYRGLQGGVVQYTAYDGILPLREAIADKLRRENGLRYSAEDIIVTNGAQESIFVLCGALLNPGDEVIVTNPYYSAYRSIVALSGGLSVPVPVRPETGWSWDIGALEAAVTPRTRLIIVVSPDNPTGAVVSRNTLLEIARVAQAHDLLVVSDELYEKYLYDGAVHTSVASLPGMHERTITVNGFSKSFGMTGWRVGYLAVPGWLKQVATEVKHMHSISTALPSQLAALEALSGPQTPWHERLRTYAERRKFLLDRLEGMNLPVVRTQGSYYVMADIRASGMNSMSFSAALIESAGVRVGPGVVFGSGAEGFVRLSLMTPLPAMEQALDRLEAFWEPFR